MLSFLLALVFAAVVPEDYYPLPEEPLSIPAEIVTFGMPPEPLPCDKSGRVVVETGQRITRARYELAGLAITVWPTTPGRVFCSGF